MKLQVTGGAGHTSAVAACQLLGAGHQVVQLDDPSTGHRDNVPDGARLIDDPVQPAGQVLNASVDRAPRCAARSLVADGWQFQQAPS